MGGNKGLSAAQNRGIEAARALGASHVLIFDHDSDPPHDLVENLVNGWKEAEAQGLPVAAVGPRYIDTRRHMVDRRSPFVRFKGCRIARYSPERGGNLVLVDFLIASGSLISMRALDGVGTMNEGLFIDYVDVEWGLRARQRGWALYGVWNVIMEHNLGEAHTKALGRELAVHSPRRHGYLVRNAVWLCLYADLRLSFKLAIFFNISKKIIVYSIFMPHPLSHFRFMCLGAWRGLCGHMGELR